MSRITLFKKPFLMACITVAFLVSGCVTNQYPYAEGARPTDRVVGIGYAVIGAQPGLSLIHI